MFCAAVPKRNVLARGKVDMIRGGEEQLGIMLR
jgi:hypothetical protein